MKTIIPAIALFVLMAAGATTSVNAACNSCAPRACNTCAPRVAYVAMERKCATCNPCDTCGSGWFW